MVGTSRLMRDLAKAVIDDEPDLGVVADLEADEQLISSRKLLDADCILTAFDGPPAVLCRTYEPLIRERPDLRVVGIVDGGRHCLVYELVPRCTVIGELSPEVLLRAIRRSGPATDEGGDGLR